MKLRGAHQIALPLSCRQPPDLELALHLRLDDPEGATPTQYRIG